MSFNYQSLIDEAMLGVVRKILTNVENNGLTGDQSFYVSFRTHSKGVGLSKAIKQKYPKEITIVLQHQFRNLRIFEDKFTVNITFSGIAEDIEVPFDAITSFLDPVANFGFQFIQQKKIPVYKNAAAITEMIPASNVQEKRKTLVRDISKKAEIVAIDKFRKKLKEKNKSS